jgi:hypothetical protein
MRPIVLLLALTAGTASCAQSVSNAPKEPAMTVASPAPETLVVPKAPSRDASEKRSPSTESVDESNDSEARGNGLDDGSASDDRSIGIKTCHDFLVKLRICAMKLSGSARPALQQAWQETRQAFVTVAATPEGRRQLEIACKPLLDALSQNPACK